MEREFLNTEQASEIGHTATAIPENGNNKPTTIQQVQVPGSPRWASLKLTISRTLVRLQQYLHRLDLQLTRHAHNPNTEGLLEMTATEDAQEVDVYLDHLNWALRQPAIKNIALTGPFGSGKSSIIATFRKRHKNFRYLHLSLAKFKKEYAQDEAWERDVELSILQQIFYHEKGSKLPDSRFKKITRTSNWKIALSTLGWLIWGISLFLIYQPGFFERFSWWDNIAINYRDIIFTLALPILLLGIGRAFYQLYRTLKKIRFNKVAILSGEVELGNQDDTSIFNKHLDEIIYFFEVTRVNVVIIEDLDRINDPAIFTKLREINFLINNSKQVSQDVKFLYALKDDVFSEEARSKFFDHIIPVIPVINTSNAVDKLISYLDGTQVSKWFIQSVALYINDMRTLKNIVNEFKLYRKAIGTKLDPDKMLAIIIYKNLNPTEFEKLHHYRQGEIYQLFSNKNNIVKSQVNLINEEISLLKKEIDTYDNIILQNLNELRAVYLMKIFEQIPAFKALTFHSNAISLKEANTEEFFEYTIKHASIVVQHIVDFRVKTEKININFNQIQQEVMATETYELRKEKMLSAINNERQKLDFELYELTKRADTLTKSPLKYILREFAEFPLPDKIKENSLLLFLVRNGCIDESYPSYMSYFYEGAMTQRDRDFVLSVLNHVPLDFTAEIDNPELVAAQLHYPDYERESILNYQYLTWLYMNKKRFENELDALYDHLLFANRDSVEFINGALDNKLIAYELCTDIYLTDFLFCRRLIIHGELSPAKIDRFLYCLLKKSEDQVIKNMISDSDLLEYLEARKDIFWMEGLTSVLTEMSSWAIRLKIKFQWLEDVQGTEELFDFVYENNLYEINAHNINVLAIKKGLRRGTLQADLETKNYTSIMDSGALRLQDYVNKNIAEYVERVMLPLEKNTGESETAILTLLNKNDDELSPELKKRVITKQDKRINNLTLVPKILWTHIISEDKAVPSWPNCFFYWNEIKWLDTPLAEYLSKPDNYFHLDDLYALELLETNPEESPQLFNILLHAGNLDIKAYRHFLKVIPIALEAFDGLPLDLEQVEELVGSDRLHFTPGTFEYLKDRYSNKLYRYVEKHIDAFLAAPELALNEHAYNALIASTTISEEIKLKIIERLPMELLRQSYFIGETLLGFLLQNQDALDQVAPVLIIHLIHEPYDFDQRKELLIRSVQRISEEDRTKVFAWFGNEYKELIPTGKQQTKIPLNEQNRRLLEKLKDIKQISSFTKRKDEFVVYFHTAIPGKAS
ncbi:MAG: P-loop NTPase fold protein [Candidatus Pseudobacter hemicellulosilyticus]|uniref:P-loop NTPase fold protein n=1 Tax=Candidatus Pseudobacter hemicellulosilyticus TaxID=3121375 RepID=A0AAJ5WSE5_9BACT|nr:MAG: P-loop NTPase fold protein [Pseudobacter sp.]